MCDQVEVAKVFEFNMDDEKCNSITKEKLITKILFDWENSCKEMNPRRTLARKIIKLHEHHRHIDAAHFEYLALEVDSNGMCKNLMH